MKLEPNQIPSALRNLESFVLTKKGVPDAEQQQRLSEAFHEVPETRIIEQAHYLKEHMLPRIAQNRGQDSEDYRFYYSLVESLMYMLKVLGRDYQLRHELSNQKLLNEFIQRRCVFLEGELQRYTTIEDLLYKQTSQGIVNIITNPIRQYHK